MVLASPELKQTDTLDSRASRRMLPKLVTGNVTDTEIGGIVFRNKIIPKNSINEVDEKTTKKNDSYLV